MSHGEIAAAVIMPILAAIALFALLFFCRRRRRGTPSPRSTAFLPAMREKMGYFRYACPCTLLSIPLIPSANTRISHRPTSPSTISDPSTPTTTTAGGLPAPILTAARNTTYYTGLDTSSHGSHRSQHSTSQEGRGGEEFYAPRRSEGGTFADPPPPYGHENKPPQLPPFDVEAPHLRTPSPVRRTRSPFDDPVSPLHEGESAGRLFAAAALEPPPPISRATTSASISRAPSISSTQYSDTASVHSARAARMSVGGSRVVTQVLSSPGQRMSVFDDPPGPVSPVSEVGRGGGL